MVARDRVSVRRLPQLQASLQWSGHKTDGV